MTFSQKAELEIVFIRSTNHGVSCLKKVKRLLSDILKDNGMYSIMTRVDTAVWSIKRIKPESFYHKEKNSFLL